MDLLGKVNEVWLGIFLKTQWTHHNCYYLDIEEYSSQRGAKITMILSICLRNVLFDGNHAVFMKCLVFLFSYTVIRNNKHGLSKSSWHTIKVCSLKPWQGLWKGSMNFLGQLLIILQFWLRHICSMSMFTLMCVYVCVYFFLPYELLHVVIQWDGKSRNKIKVSGV